MIYVYIIFPILCLLYLLIDFAIDNLITRKRLKNNQIAWDEYSKNMTYKEKLDYYVDWVEQNKIKNGWKHYYLPSR